MRIQNEICEMRTLSYRVPLEYIRCRENVLVIIDINLPPIPANFYYHIAPIHIIRQTDSRFSFPTRLFHFSRNLCPSFLSSLLLTLSLFFFFYEYKRVRALVSSTIISIMRLMVKCKSFNKCNIVRPSQKSVRNRECTDLLRGSRLFRDVAGYP